MPVKQVVIGEQDLTLKDYQALLSEGYTVQLSEKGLRKAEESYTFLKQFSSGKLIYGINTGFGPMAQYKIPDSEQEQLQYNLIRSHCSGMGELLTPLEVKALMISRLSSMMQGYSGVSKDLITLLSEYINRDITPCIHQHGGVGASGDLVQLAHLALTLIGEGEVMYKGAIVSTAEALKQEGLTALKIHHRDGIGILNGTSAMTGIAAINLLHAQKLINWSTLFSAIINEVVEAYDDAFSLELNAAKRHPGQQKVAEGIRRAITGSKLIRKRNDHLYQPEKIQVDVVKDKVQEYYSLRCVPQILGPIYETIEHAEKVIVNEINSANDNPVINVATADVYHGGNFHGDYISLEMDKLKIAITKLAMLSERQLNYLVNDKLNQKFPPFLNKGRLGLNFGVQGMQFTATSTVAECQTLSNPAYVHSIPNNNDNQDIVSMGTNSALITKKVIDNAFEVLAIHATAILQAIDCAGVADQLSPMAQQWYAECRKIVPVIVEDTPHYKRNKQVATYLKESTITVLHQ